MADKHLVLVYDEDDDTGEGIGTLNPFEQHESILIDETTSMENGRRQLEQKGHRRYGTVNGLKDRSEHQVSAENELGSQAGPKEHPFLSSQRFDGIDPSLNPAPDIGTEARREFDNERRNQEQEKQHRLGNMPSYSRNNTPEYKP